MMEESKRKGAQRAARPIRLSFRAGWITSLNMTGISYALGLYNIKYPFTTLPLPIKQLQASTFFAL